MNLNTESPTKPSENLDPLFRATFEQAAVGIAHVTPNGKFLRINQKFCDILGYPMSELIEKTFQDITYPDDLDRDLKKINELLQGKLDTYSTEKRYTKQDGSTVWASLTVNLIFKKGGDPDYFIAVVQDISQRKQAEEELRISEENFRGVFNTMIDVFTRSDLEGNSTMISPSVKDVAGYTPEDVVGRNYSEFFVDPDQWWEDAEAIRKANGETVRLERAIKRKDGSRMFISSNARIFFDEAGNPAGIESVFRDITQQKLSESEHDKLFNYSFDLLCIAGIDGYFKELNPSWEKATGYSIEELSSKPFTEFIHPEDRERTLSEMEALSKGDITIDFENRYLKKNGEVLHLSWAATPMPAENLVYCIARDISARKLTEGQLMEYQQRLKDLARKLTITEEKVKKQVAVDLHDNVGQMLTSIRMQLSRIEEMEENPDLKIRMKYISDSLLTAIQSTRNAIFNLSLPQLTELGLSAAVSDWVKSEVEVKYNLKVEIESNIDNFQLSEEMRILLFRSTRELINNVLKHARASSIIIRMLHKGDELEIQVEDDGVGFNYNSDLMRLKSNVYGLFTIQERVSDLGGTMQVDSIADQGTKVSLSIPLKNKYI